MGVVRTLLVHPSDGSKRVETALEEAGCRVTRVERATTALARLSTEQYDCVVSEYELPGDDGLTLLRAVQETDPELPFVLFTGVEDDWITTEAFENGVDRCLLKNGSESLDRLTDDVTEVATAPDRRTEQVDVTGHEPSAEELARAVNEAPLGITLTDPSLPDNPLVFLNDAWGEMTGYDREYMLGRNARLLQGPETDPQTVERLARSIENEEPVTVEIRNYRKDGTPFWNELTIAPVEDDDGEIAHYVGFQNDITDRKAAEALAEERAERLQEERAGLERVLTRTNELLGGITRSLVEETDRQVIAQRLCESLVEAEGYTASWFGTTNGPDTQIDITAGVGVPEETVARQELESLPSVVEEAIESGTVTCSRDGTCNGAVLSPASIGARRLAVVPIVYRRKRYGLIGIYGESLDTLDAREQALLSSIGKMIACGLNAVETRRILTADEVIEIEVALRDDSLQLSQVANAFEGEIDCLGVTTDTDSCEFYLTTNAVDEQPAELLEMPGVENVQPIADTESEFAFRLETASTSPFDELAEYGGVVTEVSATAEEARIVVELPPEHDVRSVLDLLRELYDEVELRSRQERERRERTPHEFASLVDEKLTDRQQAALKAAKMNGYFEWPRPVDGSDIAETMGITRQTFHQHLRAAERKLVDAYVEYGSC